MTVPRRAPWAITKRIGSLMGLLALLVGAPAALLFDSTRNDVQSDLRLLEHPVALWHQLNHPLSDSALQGAILILAWVVWTYFALCVLLDIVGRFRGRRVVRLPGSGHAQALVAAVVGASISLLPVTRSMPSVRLQPVTVAAHQHAVRSESAKLVRSLDDAKVGRVPHPVWEPAVTEVTYTVQPGDTLWSIAERVLGSPLRWKEIADENLGRPQADGQALENDNWLLPGWVLVLPLQSTVAAAPQLTSERAASSEPAPQRSAVVRSGNEAGVPVVPIGIGILGAGVVMMLDRMRRAQQRRRGEGKVIRLPKGDELETERGLRVANDIDTASALDLGTRLLGVVGGQQGRRPSVLAVRCGGEHLEFVFDPADRPGLPLPPFEISSDPAVWILPNGWQAADDRDWARALAGKQTPCPALVTLGYDARGQVLVNLEALGSLSVGGEDSDMTLQAMAVELATLSWAESVDVIVVGHPGELRGLERVRPVSSVAAAVAEVRRRGTAPDLIAFEPTSEWPARDLSTTERSWEALVVVCLPAAARAEPAACQRLVEMAGDGRHGVTVLVGDECPGSRWATTADGGPVRLTGPTPLWPKMTALAPQRVVPGLLADVDELISLATGGDEDVPLPVMTVPSPVSAPPSPPPPPAPRVTAGPPPPPVHSFVTEPVQRTAPPASSISEAGFQGVPSDHEIEVRILGPVEISGNAKPFLRAWSMELVVYLALHPAGATTDEWSAALWPDRLMAPASLHSTASAARRALGTSVTGEDHLPRSQGRLTLGKSVTTDWTRFQVFAAHDTPDSRADALSLVRGRPFHGLRSDWSLLEGFVASIEGLVVDVACRQAEWLLDRDPASAELVARQGLRVSAYDERLYRVLLRAADAAGNPAGVERAMDELVRLVADDVEPWDAVHPETLDLYRRLSRRAGARRGA